MPPPKYDASKTFDQLTDRHFESNLRALEKEGLKTTGIRRHDLPQSQVRAITSGSYNAGYSYHARAQSVDKYGVYYCPYITQLEITFFYQSTIFMAKELKKGSCAYDEVMKHEWKHHTANTISIKKYSDKLKEDLPIIVRELEDSLGYVDGSQIQTRYDMIKLAVQDVLDIYYGEAMKEQEKRNDLIDTPFEYARVNTAIQVCKNDRGE